MCNWQLVYQVLILGFCCFCICQEKNESHLQISIHGDSSTYKAEIATKQKMMAYDQQGTKEERIGEIDVYWLTRKGNILFIDMDPLPLS